MKNPLHIYLIKRPEGIVAYDEMRGFVIASSSARTARKIAASSHSDEGADVWTDCNWSTCTTLGVANAKTQAGVLLQDHKTA